MEIHMVKNPDIIAGVANADSKPFTVGFAAETNDVLKHAQQKLEKKKLDLIIANDVSDKSIGFNSDANAVTLIDLQSSESLSMRSKTQLARDIVSIIAKKFGEKNQQGPP
eukprot:TRINITY_DN101830_c0_g1_i2.p2 TRINITY_DN101830_c0_g1~~TRINITY_DN101830_c0_g1_i2.p2  ORF type:complete len:110 (-),score=14.69 TRINITY_DN101830_c0_g1_i2:234-563(-)